MRAAGSLRRVPQTTRRRRATRRVLANACLRYSWFSSFFLTLPRIHRSRCVCSLLFVSITLVMDSIIYRQYSGESELPHIMALVQHELSEPYVIYTYRYFLQQW